MQENTPDGQSIAARLRLLGPPTLQVDESKIAVAVALAHDLLAAANSSPPRADDPPLPVLAHYCRTVTEWASSCLLKMKPPPPLALAPSQPGVGAAAAATTTAGAGANAGGSSGDGGPSAAKSGSPSATPQDGAAQDPRAAYLARVLRLWRLLQLMLEGGDPRVSTGGAARRTAAVLALVSAAAGSVPGSILNSAAACLRVALARPWAASPPPLAAPTALAADATDADGEHQLPLAAQLCRAIRCCLNVLLSTAGGGGGAPAAGGGAMRPSLEQCLALLTALMNARPPSRHVIVHQSANATAGEGTDAHRMNAAVEAEWARLCAAVVHVTHGSVQGHPAPKKVWKAFVPELVLPLLAVSQPGEALGATLQLVLGTQAGGAAAAAVGAAAAGVAPAAMMELGRAAQQLLAAVLFHEAHVGAMAELFAALLPGSVGSDGVEPESETTTAAAGAGADSAAPADAAAAAADAAGGTAAGSGKGGGGGSSGTAQLLLPGFWELVGRSYHGQLLQVLATAVAGGTCGAAGSSDRSRRGGGGGGGGGGGAIGSGGTAAAGGTADAILQGLPWLLRTFCRAVARLRRSLSSDAAAAAAAAGAGGGSAGKGKRPSAADGAAGAGDEDGVTTGAASQKALAAAEFNCMVVMSYILLQPPQPPTGGADAAAGRPAKKRKLAAAEAVAAAATAATGPAFFSGSGGPWRRLALAGLLAAGRAIGAYQPTRDLTGAHYAVLAVIADRLLAAATPAQPADAKSAKAQRKAAAGRATATPTTDGGAGSSGGGGDAAGGAGMEPYGSLRSLSTSLALCAVLDLDHRVLAPHLERVWSLLWSTAAGDPAPTSTPTATMVTSSAALTSRPVHDAGSAAAATAAAVLQRTLRAFSELRQLQSLLESLGAGMRAVYGGGGGSSGAEDPPVGAAAAAASRGGDGGVVAALLVRPEVTAALRQAIGSAPSGQLPALVGWVATDLEAWCEVVPVATHGSANLFLAAGALYDTLLAALRLDLATAMPVAKASVRLLETLAAPLLSSVRQYCKARSAAAAAAAAAAAPADGNAEAAGELQLRTARLAMLLRVYGSVVHANAVCAGLHPEVQPLPDQDIHPRRREDLHLQQQQQQQQQQQAAPRAEPIPQGGYFAPLLHHAATAAAQAADGAAAAVDLDAAVADELKRLRKALKRAGRCQYRSGPLPALAQMALLPGLPSPPPPAPSPSLAPAAAGAAAGVLASASSPVAASWAEVELARAVHRCLGQRLQTLHERLLRRRHYCPLYGRAPSRGGGGGDGDGDGKPSAASDAAGAEVAAALTAEEGGPAEEKADAEAEAEEAEVRSLANLMLAPFSPKAAAAAGGGGDGSGSAPPTPYSGLAGAGCSGAAAAAAAARTAAALYTSAAWGDVLALMGSIGPWAERGALAEVLQLTLTAACRTPPSVAAGGDRVAGLRPLHAGSAASLRLLEFQGLPGVRETLPYAWTAASADALAGVAAEVRRLLSSGAAPPSPPAGNGSAANDDGPGMRPSKKARKALSRATEEDGDGGAAVAAAVPVATAESRRLEALLAAIAPKEVTGDVEDRGGGGGGKVAAKVLRRAMAQQAEALDSVVTSCTAGPDAGAVPSTEAACGGGGGVAAAAATLRSLLALLYDRLYLELTPLKARRALVQQVAVATVAAVDLLLLLRRQAAAPAPLAATAARIPKHGKEKKGKAQREQQQSEGQQQQQPLPLHSIRRELLGVAVACLRAWRRLSAAYGSSGDGGGGEFASFGCANGSGGAVEDGAGDGDGDDGADPRVTWLVRACGLLVAEAAALDGDGAAGTPLSFEVIHHSGHLLSTLLSARDGASDCELGSEDDVGKAVVRPRLKLATRFLSQAESAATPAERALLCRLGLAAVEAAAAAVAAPGAAPGDAAGRKAAVRGGSNGQGSVAGAHKALRRLSALSERLLSSSHHIGSSADEAAGAAAAAEASRASAVHALRAALCLAGCQGHVMQLSLPTAVAANGGGGGDGVAGGAKGARKEAAAAAAEAAAATTAAVRLPRDDSGGGDVGSHSGLLLRASRWAAAERRLYDILAPRGGGGGDAAAAAAVAAEPLEHFVKLMYGVGSWLPALGHGGEGGRDGGGGDGDGEPVGGGGGGAEASGRSGSTSDEALALLVAVQQSLLLACTASPERFCYSRTNNIWGVLLADLDPAGATYLSRRSLLECFRTTLAHSNRGQLAALLRGLTSRLRQEGLTEPGQPPVQLLPPLQCLLTSLECLAGPRVTKLLSANGPAVTAALTELLAAAAARASVAASCGAGGGDAAWFFGGAANRATTEAVLCCALRCLQSVAGREVTFRLAAPAVTGVLSAVLSLAACPMLRPQPLLPNPTAAVSTGLTCGRVGVGGGGGGGGGSGQDLYFLHASCCGLVAAVVRHHETVVRHCAALVVGACRELLLRLAAWASELRAAQRQLQLRPAATPAAPAAMAAVAAASDGLERCAAALARVYEAVSEHPKTLGKYAPHILADYIVHAATPLPSLALLMHANDGGIDPWVTSDAAAADAAPDAAAAEGGALVGGAAGGGGGSDVGVGATLLPQRAHEALRQGAFSLMGCMGPPQLQHLHMAMGAAAGAGADTGGGARRAALAQLRKEYDSSYKYTGKV